jgi:hypothetical protein
VCGFAALFSLVRQQGRLQQSPNRRFLPESGTAPGFGKPGLASVRIGTQTALIIAAATEGLWLSRFLSRASVDRKLAEGTVAMRAVANAAQVSANPLPAMAASAQEILRQSTYPALWDLHCQQADGAVILRGQVPLFYLKQLAQVLVAKVLGGGQILNEIEVADPSAATKTLVTGDRGQHVRHLRHPRTYSR